MNTPGNYKGRSDELFQGIKALKKIREPEVHVTLNADAHHPQELNNYFGGGKETLRKIRFGKQNALIGSGWQEVGF